MIARELLGFIWAIAIKLRSKLSTARGCKGKTKTKNLPNREKAKTLNKETQLEDKVSRSRGKHEGESPAEVCDRPAGLAWLVRGSSRRILIMRFRPANISLINRRHYPLPAKVFDPVLDRKSDQSTLTGLLHITSESAVIRPECLIRA